jgi:hypothetical protein
MTICSGSSASVGICGAHTLFCVASHCLLLLLLLLLLQILLRASLRELVPPMMLD